MGGISAEDLTGDDLGRVRALCLSLPETAEKAGARPAFQVRGKTFVMYMDDHHGDGRLALWCKMLAGAQPALVASEPDRYFVPPYVGPSGWVGLRLDLPVVDWDEVAGVVEDAYEHVSARAAKRR